MTDVHGDSTMIGSDNIPESVLNVDPVSVGLPLEHPLEPCEGMGFASIEDAKNYYTRYAKNIGFSFRMGRVTKSRTNGMIIGQEILCSREGFRAKKYARRENSSLTTHNETRVGCKAMLYLKKNEDRWIISRFRRDHNHELFSPESSQSFRVHRKKTKVQKKLTDVLDDSGLGPSKITPVLCSEIGGVDNVGFSQQDVINYLSVKRQKQLEKGDAQLMLSYFKNCQLKNIGFFYAFQMDAEGQLANCFWVDSRSRMAYKYFGDVVTVDPTYLTNKYKMPFVPFIGVNHHQQSILFGCALLWDETEDSFAWLLSTWLEAMDGACPKTIITDQDTTITNAVARVFPEVNHHYCMWHIEKEVSEYLNYIYHEHSEFKNQFYKCIHQSITIEEFDSDWEAMIDKYGLQDNQWLEKIYSIRAKWIPAYVRHNFCAEYVLPRWTINAKKEKVKGLAIDEFQEGNNKASSTSLFNSVMIQSLELSERASQSGKHYDVANQGLQKLIAELDLLELEESNEEFGKLTCEVMPKSRSDIINGQFQNSNVEASSVVD